MRLKCEHITQLKTNIENRKDIHKLRLFGTTKWLKRVFLDFTLNRVKQLKLFELALNDWEIP